MSIFAMTQHAPYVQIAVQGIFPVDEHQALASAAESFQGRDVEVLREFGRTMNNIVFRLRAALEEAEALAKTVERPESTEANYRRESHFYGLYVNGLSALESICYAGWVLAALNSRVAVDFAEKTRRRVPAPRFLREALPADGPGAVLKALLMREHPQEDPPTTTWNEWASVRNTLAHRSNIGRKVFVSIGDSEDRPSELQVTWSAKRGIVLNRPSIEAEAEWLAGMARQLLDATLPLATE